jgi:alpha-methylacyl-CoA racemase
MGPLKGLRVVELEGLGPAPFCGMMLADMGAEVISVARRTNNDPRPGAVSERGKKSIALNLKDPDAIECVLKLCETADVLIEGFRPGVTERLGIGPDVCLARNPKLVYGRMTGWGQTGPLAKVAGHDLNYIALSGALHAMGRAGERPVPPLNLVGDFGGGGMMLAFGIMCAVFEAQRSGKGQVIDTSMVDGAAALMHMMYAWMAQGQWQDKRASNMLDGAAHFYDTYETKDGKFVSIGSIEPQFYAMLLEQTGVDKNEFAPQLDAAQWPQLKDKLIAVFKTKTRDEWCAIMEGTDVCFAPVLSMLEAPEHAHNKDRGTFLTIDGVLQPAPAPRFSRTVAEVAHAPHTFGSDTTAVLEAIGYNAEQINALRSKGALG